MNTETKGQGEREGASCSLYFIEEEGGEAPIVSRGVNAHISSLARQAALAFKKVVERGRAKDERGAKLAMVGNWVVILPDIETSWKAGKSLTQLQLEEAYGIFRCAFVKAFHRVGLCPSSVAALWGRTRGHELNFSQLRQWLEHYREASRAARSYLWGGGAEEHARTTESLEAIQRTPDGLSYTLGEMIASPSKERDRGKEALSRRCSERYLRHARLCLRAYWATKGGQRWQQGLASENALLRACSKVARGESLADCKELEGFLNPLVSEDGRGKGLAPVGDKLRDKARDLREHLASGDLIITASPEGAGKALLLAYGQKYGGRMARELVKAEVLPVGGKWPKWALKGSVTYKQLAEEVRISRLHSAFHQ